jgi:hypothetical protein
MDCAREFPAGHSQTTYLHLYRQVGDELVEVLRTDIASTDVQRGPNEMFKTEGTLAAGPVSEGMASWVLSWKRTREPLLTEEESPEGTSETTGKTTFVWTGQRYEATGR